MIFEVLRWLKGGGASFQGLLRELRLRCLRELRGLRRGDHRSRVFEGLRWLGLRGGIIYPLREGDHPSVYPGRVL